jgi:hypothetical protein
MGQMGKSNTVRMKLGRAASLSAMALAALTMVLPGAANAQERQARGGRRGEMRSDRPARPMMQNRSERAPDFRQQRQIAPRALPSGASVGSPRMDSNVGREIRGTRSDGQRREWGAQGSANGATWQQRQGVRPNPGDGRAAEQWRERRENRVEGQTGAAVIRRAPGNPQWRGERNDNGRRSDVRPENRPDWQNNRGGWQNRDDRRDNRARWQNNRPGWQDGRRNEAGRDNGLRNDRRGNQGWDRGWRSNNRYNWSNYRAQNRGIYRPGRYVSPYSSYRYNRIGIGFTMQSLFYRQNYWLSDPWQYRLPEVYGPYRWVRYYDDVVLVDVYSGEVVDVIYDFFW